MVSRAPTGDDGGVIRAREASVYQVFLNDIYAQWLEEFDREAAIKRLSRAGKIALIASAR